MGRQVVTCIDSNFEKQKTILILIKYYYGVSDKILLYNNIHALPCRLRTRIDEYGGVQIIFREKRARASVNNNNIYTCVYNGRVDFSI